MTFTLFGFHESSRIQIVLRPIAQVFAGEGGY